MQSEISEMSETINDEPHCSRDLPTEPKLKCKLSPQKRVIVKRKKGKLTSLNSFPWRYHVLK